jgi:hypothetical protein
LSFSSIVIIESLGASPYPPSLNTPANLATVANATPTLNFTGTDLDGNNLEYNIQIDTANTFNSQSGNPLISAFSATDAGFTSGHPFNSGTAINYIVQSALTNNTVYYWRVIAKDPSGTNDYGLWSSTYSFTVPPPPTVALISPADAATVTSQTPTLDFTGTALSGTDLEYTIQVSATSSFSVNTNFNALGTGTHSWYSIAIDSSNHNVYVCGFGGYIYLQTGGIGSFNIVSTGPIYWYYLAIDQSNHNVYAGVGGATGGDIYVQTGGIGSFNALGVGVLSWYNIAIDQSNHNVYACARGGDIYVQTGGTGNFVASGVGVLNWYGIAIDQSNHNVYACAYGKYDIYVQTGGTGDFNALVVDKQTWRSIAIDQSNHNVYACADNYDIYVQTGGVGSFNALGAGALEWFYITIDQSNHNVYACVGGNTSGDIYVQTGGTGSFNALGTGTHIWHSIAIDQSNHNVYACVAGGDMYEAIPSTFINQVSTINSGFADITHGSDTHPFPSGDQIGYTVQTGDALANGNYYWRVAAIDPSGTNIYGAWTTTRSFTVVLPPPTIVLNTPTDVATIPNTAPTFQFTGTSYDSSTLEYNIEIDNYPSNFNFALTPKYVSDISSSCNNPYCICQDSNYVYAAENNAPAKVVRYNKSTASIDAVRVLATGESYAKTICQDANYVYVGLRVDPSKVVRILKSDFTTTKTKTLATGETNTSNIAQDNTYIYIGTNTAPCKIVRLSKSDFTTTTTKTLASGEDYIDSMVVDNNYIYIGTDTIPAKIVRLSMSDFTTTTTKTFASGEGPPYGMTQDASYVYAGLMTSPGKIVRLSKSDFSTTSTVTLATGMNNIESLDQDLDFVYGGVVDWNNGSGSVSAVARVQKSDFSTVVTRIFDTNEYAFYGMTSDDVYLYMATTVGDSLMVRIKKNNPLLAKYSTNNNDVGFTAGHPFTSGVAEQYTVQTGEALALGAYSWRVRCQDYLGMNVYSDWSGTRTFTVTSATGTGIKVWDGSSWSYKPVKVWTGSTWVAKPVKVWNGSAWITKG